MGTEISGIAKSILQVRAEMKSSLSGQDGEKDVSVSFMQLMNQNQFSSNAGASANVKRLEFSAEGRDWAKEAYGNYKDSVKTVSVQEAKSPKETLQALSEPLEAYEEEVSQILKDELGVTDEEIADAMESLGISFLDLRNPQDLAALVQELTGEEIGMLFSSDTFQNVMEQVADVTDALRTELGVTKEEWNALCETAAQTAEADFADVKASAEKQILPDMPNEELAEAPRELPKEAPVMQAEDAMEPEWTKSVGQIMEEGGQAEEDMQAAEGVSVAEEAPMAEDMKAAEEAPMAEDMKAAEEAPVAEDMKAAEEVPVAEDTQAADEAPVVATVRTDETAREQKEPVKETEDVKAQADQEEQIRRPVAEFSKQEAGTDADSDSKPDKQTFWEHAKETKHDVGLGMAVTGQQAARSEEFAIQPEAQPAYSGQIDTIDLIEQIAKQVRVTISTTATFMEMQLNPEHLGKIYLNISEKEGAVRAQIAAQNEAVKEALETQVAELRQSLHQQGVKVDAIEVTVATHEFEQNLEQNARQEEQMRQQREEIQKQARRNLNLNDLDGLTGLMSEEEELAARIMRDNGNQVDLTA